jgi:transposase
VFLGAKAGADQGKESPVVKYRVTLTEQERESLKKRVSAGKGAARQLLHARILLLTDQGEYGQHRSDDEITDALGVSRSTIYRLRERFVEDSLEAALVPRKMPKRPDKVKIQGEAEKKLIALACSDPPEGRCRWTMELLADRVVQLGVVQKISQETVRLALKKMTSAWNK